MVNDWQHWVQPDDDDAKINYAATCENGATDTWLSGWSEVNRISG